MSASDISISMEPSGWTGGDKASGTLAYASIFLLCGFTSSFKISSVLLGISNHVYELEIEEENVLSFISHTSACLILAFMLSCVLSFLLFPTSMPLVLLSSCLLGICYAFECLLYLIEDYDLMKSFFVTIILLNGVSCGMLLITSYSMTVLNKTYGNVTERVIAVVFVNLMGVFLANFTTFLVRFVGDDIDNITRARDLSKSFLIMVSFPCLFTLILVALHLKTGLKEHGNDTWINVFTHFNCYKKSFNILIRLIGPISLLMAFQSFDTFFNVISVIGMINPYPQIEDLESSSALSVIGLASIICGTLIIYGINSSNAKPDCNRIHSRSVLGPFTQWKLMWILFLLVRIPSGILIILTRHYENLTIDYFKSFHFILTSVIFNGVIKGLTISMLYIVIVNSSIQLMRELYNADDIHDSAARMISLIVTAVVIIDLSCVVTAGCIGYNYQFTLSNAELMRSRNESWPTNHLSNNVERLSWWIYNTITNSGRNISSLHRVE